MTFGGYTLDKGSDLMYKCFSFDASMVYKQMG